MVVKDKISQILCIFTILLLSSPSPTMQETKTTNDMVNVNQLIRGLEDFSINIFSELTKRNSDKENIIVSPFSIQTCLAMARMGAENDTALEMDTILGLPDQGIEELAKSYNVILSPYVNSSIITIANKIYIMSGYEIREDFNESLTKGFFSSAETLNFGNNVAAAKTINSWVESKTNNLIKDLILPPFLNANTRVVLVNAIHFKGEWVHAFPKHKTRPKDFYLDDINTVKVQMMHIKQTFLYGHLSELDATALEMPYKDSDLSMLIVLPNSRTGLPDLQEKMKSFSLLDILKGMYRTKVNVEMPKFKTEFAVELSDTLMNLGMGRAFSDNAEFGKMLKSKDPLKVSGVIHKAFIEVNEEGTEAAAATVMGIRKKRALEDSTDIKHFTIEHPFVFKILQTISSETSTSMSNIILFEGKIEKLVTTDLNAIKDEL